MTLARIGRTILDKVIREGFSREVILEKNLNEVKGMSPEEQEKGIQGTAGE